MFIVEFTCPDCPPGMGCNEFGPMLLHPPTECSPQGRVFDGDYDDAWRFETEEEARDAAHEVVSDYSPQWEMHVTELREL